MGMVFTITVLAAMLARSAAGIPAGSEASVPAAGRIESPDYVPSEGEALVLLAGEVISLPSVPRSGDVSVEEAIRLRRSIRSYTGEEPSLDVISRLCWAAQGITGEKYTFRSTPSAGATYPLELYVATSHYVARYVPARHHLAVVSKEDVRDALSQAALDQECVKNAPVVFIIAADVKRTTDVYGDRGYLYVHIEVGCAAENLMLEAVALGWGSVPIGAYEDDEVKKLLGLPPAWDPYLIIPIGRPVR